MIHTNPEPQRGGGSLIPLNASRLSKEDADARADAEYEELAARRWAALKAEAESLAFQILEEQTQRRRGKKP